MKIGILGAGNVGTTLGTRWANGGHQVVIQFARTGFSENEGSCRKGWPEFEVRFCG